ncbi:uncharacterized protein DS421_13g424020 [Arachis hypogaea]|nr:uncharacterized protein DS421_13g424020 [Arachis hypogaea]
MNKWCLPIAGGMVLTVREERRGLGQRKKGLEDKGSPRGQRCLLPADDDDNRYRPGDDDGYGDATTSNMMWRRRPRPTARDGGAEL